MTARTPAQLATEMQALQEHIDAFNKDVGAEILRLNLQRHALMNKGAELGFSRRHMHEWLARVPKQEAELPITLADGSTVTAVAVTQGGKAVDATVSTDGVAVYAEMPGGPVTAGVGFAPTWAGEKTVQVTVTSLTTGQSVVGAFAEEGVINRPVTVGDPLALPASLKRG